jgi:hypothetical protein
MRLGCPSGVCSGTVIIRQVGPALRAADARAGSTVLGRARFSVKGGLARSVLVRLDERGRALLKDHPGSRVELVAMLAGAHPRTVIDRHAWLKATAGVALGCHAHGTAGAPLRTTAKLSSKAHGKPVTFVYTRPDGTSFYMVSSTAHGGLASNVIKPKAAGPWKAAATWPGDSRYFEVHARPCSFTIGRS